MKADRIERSVDEQLKTLPFSPATVKQDVSQKLVFYLFENQDRFPGVTVEQVFLREYPQKQVGAHLFGTVGEITKEQRDDPRYRGVDLGDRIGQSGIEAQYDRYLRGQNGSSRVQVDAMGNLRSQLRSRRPQQGRQLRLSVDLDVQRVGQRALGGAKGAFAVMNVNNGEVIALGSSPSFDPNVFAKTIRKRDLDRLYSKDNGEPILNRAIQAGYPTGSTFKLITATAALEGGLITPDTRDQRRRLDPRGRRDVQERRRRGERPGGAAPRAVGVQRRVLLPPRPGGQRLGRRAADPELGAQARAGPAHRDRPAGGGARA